MDLMVEYMSGMCEVTVVLDKNDILWSSEDVTLNKVVEKFMSLV